MSTYRLDPMQKSLNLCCYCFLGPKALPTEVEETHIEPYAEEPEEDLSEQIVDSIEGEVTNDEHDEESEEELNETDGLPSSEANERTYTEEPVTVDEYEHLNDNQETENEIISDYDEHSEISEMEEESINEILPVIGTDNDLPPIKYLTEDTDIDIESPEVSESSNVHEEERLDNQEDELNLEEEHLAIERQYRNNEEEQEEEKEEEEEEEETETGGSIQYIPDEIQHLYPNDLISFGESQIRGNTRIYSALTGWFE